MKKILTMALLLVSGLTLAQETTDKLTIDDFTIKAGGTTTVDVKMTQNDATYTALQFEIYLPEGVGIATNDKGKLDITKGEMCEDTHSISSRFNKGRYIVTIGSPDKDLFIGTEGVLCTLALEATDMVSTGEQEGFLRNIKLSKPTATSNNTAEVPFGVSPYVEAKIAASGYGSFSWPRALDFSECEGVEKVYVGGEDANGKLKLVEVASKQVSAATGVILKGTTGTVNPSTMETEPAGDQGTLTPTCAGAYEVTADNTIYVLKTGSKGTGFYVCQTGVVVPQYKVYLERDASQGANMISMEEAGTTGIDGVAVADSETEAMYTVSGVRVGKPTQKGIYVSEGKKVVIK